MVKYKYVCEECCGNSYRCVVVSHHKEKPGGLISPFNCPWGGKAKWDAKDKEC